MKKTLRPVALMLVLVIGVLTLASCSTYPKVKKAFEKEGFKESEMAEEVTKKFLSAAEKDDAIVKTHALVKGTAVALVIEFNATDEVVQYFKDNKSVRDKASEVQDNEDVQAVYNALHEAGYVSGSCFIAPLSLLALPADISSIKDIVKNIK